MKLIFYTQGNEAVGLGHYYRTCTVATEAMLAGHWVLVVSDKPVTIKGLHWRANGIEEAVAILKPDWVIVDTPTIPNWTATCGAKVCLLDDPDTPVDLNISQGFRGVYKAPEYLIPPGGIQDKPCDKLANWFVWGGAADVQGLLPLFSKTVNDTALLVKTDLGKNFMPTNEAHLPVTSEGRQEFFDYALSCDKACLQFGQTVWELLFYKMPCYVFSHSERSLETSLEMSQRGWIKAWPTVGLPSQPEFIEFLSKPFEPVLAELDGLGARRIVKLLEEKRGR